MKTPYALVLLLTFLAQAALASSDAEVGDAIAAFKKAFATKEETARVDAVERLGSFQGKRIVEALAGPVAKDPSISVRRAAARALGAQWSPVAVGALARALDPAGSPDVAKAIVEALGETQADAAVPPLVAQLGTPPSSRKGAPAPDAPSDLTRPALTALEKIASPVAMDDLIQFLGKAGGGKKGKGGGGSPLAREAERALAAITGQRFSGAAEWRKWWDEKRASLKIIPVHRCEGTGKLFDHDAKKPCPYDGARNPHCGVFVKTRLEGAGTAAEPAEDKGPRGRKKGS